MASKSCGFHLTQLRRVFVFALFLIFWITAEFAFAAETIQAPAAAPGSFPGLQDVVPKASELNNDLTQMSSGIVNNVNVVKLSEDVAKLTNDWQVFNEQVQGFGDFDTWPINRLLQAQTRVDQLNHDFNKMLTEVSEPLSIFEDIRVIWSARKQYWLEWKKELKAAGAKVPNETFRRVEQSISILLSSTEQTVAQLVQLQQTISKEQDGLLGLQVQLNGELADLRQEPLKKNAHPLFTREFFNQFGPPLRSKALEGLKSTLQFPGDFFNRQGWLLAFQCLLVFLFYGTFRLLEKSTAERAEQWGFVFRRPIAAALFLASTLPQIFYVAPPPLLLLSMVSISILSASRLAATLLPHNTERNVVYALALIYIFTGALYVIGLPLPYHRMYLSLISVAAIPCLLLCARRYFIRDDRRDSVGVAMILGTAVLASVVFAEITGYVTFATRLVDATFGTLLLILFIVMLLRIVEGGIEVIFTMRKVANKQFVKQLGGKAPQRFKNLFRVILIISALNYLFAIWGLAEGFENAWKTILGLKFSIGEFTLSLQMVILILLTLYVTTLISWFIQTFIESQFFYNKRIDRGVRDAVKKLTHYVLILVGFLLAMSIAGIDLKNLTILAGAFGIGIGFGLQDIVNNFISGLILLFERPVKVGDTVVVGETWGIINSIGMRSTVVETWDQSEIIVPNSQLISEKVTNWTLSSNVSRLVVSVGVKYGTDMKKVISILEKVANEHSEVVETPKPSAIFTQFGDSSLDFELRVWVSDIMVRFKVRSDLGVAIADEFHSAGIEIPFPQRDLHLRSVEPGVLNAGTKEPETKKSTPHKKVVPKVKTKKE